MNFDPSLTSSHHLTPLSAAAAASSITTQGLASSSSSVPVRQTEMPAVAIAQVAVAPPPSSVDKARQFMHSQPAPGGRIASSTVDGLMALVDNYTANEASLESSVIKFAEAHLPSTDRPLSPKVMEAGGSKGVSGAPVILVKDAKGTVVAVAKACPKKGERTDHSDLAKELRVQNRLTGLRLSKSQCPDLIGIGKCYAQEEYYGLLLYTVAPGNSLDDIITKAGKAPQAERAECMQQLKSASQKSGTALAELHTSSRSQQPADSQRLTALYNDRFKEFKALVSSQPLPCFAKINIPEFQTAFNALLVDFRANPGPAVISHGDAHPGNIFFDGRQVTLIDNPSMSENFDSNGTGLGVAAWDAALFDQRIADFGRVGMQMTAQEIQEVENAFDEAYKLSGGSDVTTTPSLAFCQAVRCMELIILKSKESQNSMTETQTAAANETPTPEATFIENRLAALLDIVQSYKPQTQPAAPAQSPFAMTRRAPRVPTQGPSRFQTKQNG
jgi:Ser/Thr protein kinase RdoA (MazF antagonist)